MSSWLRQEARKFHAWSRPELEAFGLLVLAEVERRLESENISYAESDWGHGHITSTQHAIAIVRSLREGQ